MRITTKGRYGIRAVVALAEAGNGHPTAISRIAREEAVSPEFLEQIFFRLKKSGLIHSLRGPRGGFVLNREPGEISVHEILRAVDELVAPAPCADERSPGGCDRMANCPAHPMWRELTEIITAYLSRVTVKDLMERKGAFHPDLLEAIRADAKVGAVRS